jgi:hypothetical protein
VDSRHEISDVLVKQTFSLCAAMTCFTATVSPRLLTMTLAQFSQNWVTSTAHTDDLHPPNHCPNTMHPEVKLGSGRLSNKSVIPLWLTRTPCTLSTVMSSTCLPALGAPGDTGTSSDSSDGVDSDDVNLRPLPSRSANEQLSINLHTHRVGLGLGLWLELGLGYC